jgi:hypothetical protein
MNHSIYQLIQRHIFIIAAFLVIITGSCNQAEKKAQREKAEEDARILKTRHLFDMVKGKPFTEVRRRFDNGLSFSPVGYQLIPEWRISFPSIDSVNIYSPKKHHFLNAPVVFDHDSIFNVAWAWLKLQYIKKDSMQFMVLHVDNNVIKDEKTHVFMTFYSNDYIKNVLHADTGTLWKPTSKDTAYILKKTQQANAIIDSAFAGTTPAVLRTKTPLLTVKKEVTPSDDVDGGKSYDDYLSPTYNIVIHHAYEDFSYSYTAYVDVKGTITFCKSITFLYKEFVESSNTAMKGITDGYLKLYLDVKPASTLGIPHASIIFLNVIGYKDK